MLFFLLLQGLFALFISGGLFFKENGLKNKSIALYTLIFGLEILYFIYATSEISLVYPFLYGFFYFSSGFLYGPILFIHFQTIIFNKRKISGIDLLHLIPVVLVNISLYDVLMLPADARVEFYNTAENFFGRVMTLNYLRASHLVLYAFLCIVLFVRNKSKICVNSVFYIGSITLVYMISNIFISFLTLFADTWRDFSPYYLVSNLIVILIIAVLDREPKFLSEIKSKYQNSSLRMAEMNAIKSKIESLFLEEKIYLRNDLSIEYLSSVLDIKPPHISQTFSKLFNESFNDYVNKHRIAYSKKLLSDKTYSNYKIEVIAMDSGFNNKVTFYKAFSKFENTTPSQFRKALN